MFLGRSFWGISALAISCFAACGGESKGDPLFSSGLPRDATLAGLSEDDLTKLCLSSQQYLLANPEVQENVCKASGQMVAGFDVLAGRVTTDEAVQTSCARGYGECKTRFQSDAGVRVSSCTRPAAGCSATVAEYETCVNDNIVALEAYGNRMPACKDMKLSDIRSGDAGPIQLVETPVSCRVVRDKCPELFDSGPSQR